MITQKIFGRKPRVPNKYELIGSDLTHLELGDRSKVHEPLFWRNNVINAWCISKTTDPMDGDEFWLGIYDEPYRRKLVHAHFDAYGGMCSYNITQFYEPSEIENMHDLRIQEDALEILNKLLDEGIIRVVRPSGKRIPNI